MSCTVHNMKDLPDCDSNYQPKIKTVYVDKESYAKIGMVQAVTKDGNRLLIDNSIPDIEKVVPRSVVPIVNPYAESETVSETRKNLIEKAAAKAAQQSELESSIDISDATKKFIAAEYARLCRLHPNWKVSKAMRKAGEKYNVKFEFK